MRSQQKKRIIALALLSAFGILVSAYLIYLHYKPAGGSFCDINSYINCDIVNKSTYAEIIGIPVAALGAAMYLTLFILSLGLLKNWFKKSKSVLLAIAVLSSASLLFSLYLTYIEFFVLHAVCILCIASQIAVLAIFIISLTAWLEKSDY